MFDFKTVQRLICAFDVVKMNQSRIQNPVKHLRQIFFVEMVKRLGVGIISFDLLLA